MANADASTAPLLRRLPPLHALAAFEAAARRGSFLAAADELAVTASAISHRIRLLEERVGVRLFERRHRAVHLTQEGERYLQRVRAALRELEAASTGLAVQPRRVMRVQAAPGIGATWLAEQLVRYQEIDATLDVLLAAGYSRADLRGGAVDLAIRYGEDDWGGLLKRELMRESVFPVVSREYANRLGLAAPKDLARATLLRHPLLDWESWFEAAGLDWPEPTRGPVFDDALVMLEAAASGAGVALMVKTVYERARAREALVVPFDIEAPGASYFAVLSPAGRDKPWVREFSSWLVRRARGEASFAPV